jgi:hypothetical protein
LFRGLWSVKSLLAQADEKVLAQLHAADLSSRNPSCHCALRAAQDCVRKRTEGNARDDDRPQQSESRPWVW